jgi:ATP-dependent DNA helicase HFM1/MER3
VELEESNITQMIGRAGRPQFDESGVVVILTRSDKRVKYENIVSGNHPLESRLHLQLVEHLNTEIGLGTVVDTESARSWIRSTFFYARCRSNPTYYGLGSNSGEIDKLIEQRCLESIEELRREGLIERVNGKLSTTAYGEASARYYLKLSTIRHILRGNPQAKLKEMVLRFQNTLVNLAARDPL